MERDQAIGLEITELRLGPPGSKGSREPAMAAAAPATKKRSFATVAAESEGENEEVVEDPREGKAQKVVGWPPICSYRKNSFMGKAERSMELYVKVSMDGAPFLRKIHLKSHDGYADLSRVLASMFSNLSLEDDCGNSEYMTVYEDRDGDWMLVGDVPWEMFVESCKRLRIMRRTDAINFGDGFGLPKTTTNAPSCQSEN
ncbi:auxin-induced protein 22C-like [Nymphaea colorata]|nr:auxin-induced protein 22C-like [Nymphaea colorata]